MAAERIRQFLESYGSVEFRYAHEVLPLMRRNDPDETRISVGSHGVRLDDSLRSTYRIRVKTTASAPSPPFYPPELADAVRELVIQLDSAQDQPLCIWHIRMPSGLCYLVFELLADRRIAACVKSADQRVVNPGTR